MNNQDLISIMLTIIAVSQTVQMIIMIFKKDK